VGPNCPMPMGDSSNELPDALARLLNQQLFRADSGQRRQERPSRWRIAIRIGLLPATAFAIVAHRGVPLRHRTNQESGARMKRIVLLLAATIAQGVAGAQGKCPGVRYDHIDAVEFERFERQEAVPDAQCRNSPDCLTRNRGALARMKDPQGRASLLAFRIEQERPNWQDVAPYIGFSPEELEQFLAAGVESELAWQQKLTECLLDPSCSGVMPPEIRLSSRGGLRRLLGDDRYALYGWYQYSSEDRAFVQGMQQELPDRVRLSDAQFRRLALALADERQQLVTEARRQGLDNYGPLYEHTDLHLSGFAILCESDDIAKLKASEAAYARRLFDRARALLSRSQLAYFKQALDRSQGVFDEYLRQHEAVPVYSTVIPGAFYHYKQDWYAQEHYRLKWLRQPANYKAEAAKLEIQVRKDWHQRAVHAEVPVRTFDRLVEALAKLKLQYEEQRLECSVGETCEQSVPPEVPRDVLEKQAVSIVGASRFAAMQVYERAQSEQIHVNSMRSKLPSKHTLTDREAVKLVMALAAEHQRIVERAKQEGLSTDEDLYFLGTWRSDSTLEQRIAQQLASATENARRLHEVAARFLSREQLRYFDAVHQKEADRRQRDWNEAIESRRWVRLAATAAAQQP
jgi:hypothetical protein